MSEVIWQEEPEFIGANHAERARVGDYELVAFDLPADRAGPAVIADGIVRAAAPSGIDRARRSANIRRRKGRSRERFRQALGLRT